MHIGRRLLVKYFGRETAKQDLEETLKLIGADPHVLTQAAGERWRVDQVRGKVRSRMMRTPGGACIEYDVYVSRTDYHLRDGSILLDMQKFAPFCSPYDRNNIARQVHEHYATGRLYGLEKKEENELSSSQA